MNKTKIILLAIAGVAAAGTLAFGFLIYNAWSGKGESDEEIGCLEEDAARLSGLKVYPSSASVKATEANRRAFAEWCDLATGLASSGDVKFDPTTPASFKSFINDEAKRYSELPGSIAGRFVKTGFGFGFDEYILKGALPAAADLPRLQREWYDVSTFLNLLIDAKATSVAELAMAKGEEKPAEEVQSRGRKKNRKKAAASEEAKPDITRFNIVFTASPAALVAVLNGIAANPRFIVAESVAFARSSDEIAARLGEKSAKKPEAGGRRRRRPAAAPVPEDNAAEGSAPTGVVTDPETAPDFKVTMTVAVYDFRTKSAAREDEKEEAK